MRFPRPRKNLQQIDAGSLGGPLPMVGGQPVPIVSTHKQLGKDVTSGSDRIIETPELKERREGAQAATTEVGKAQEVASLGVAPEVAAAAPAPTVVAPVAPPTGQGLTGGIPQMATLPMQQDANKQALDALAKEQADKRAEHAAWVNGEVQKRTDTALQSIAKAETEYKAASKRLTEKPNNGWLHDALSALAAGFGAYGAAKTGTPNFALQIIENASKQDFEKRKADLDAKYEEYKMAGARLKDIDPWKDREMGRLLAEQKSRLEQLQKAADVALSRFPQAKLQTDAAIAASKEKIAQTQLGYVAEVGKIHRNYSETKRADTQTETTPKGEARSFRPTESENKLALLGQSMKDELKAIRSGAQLTSKDLDTVQSDTLKAESADKLSEEGQLAATGMQLGRAFDVVPRSRYSSLGKEQQKTMNAWDNAIEKYARMLTGAGMPAEEARRMARQNGPMAGDTPEMIQTKLERLEREADRMVNLSGPAAGKLEATRAPSPATAAKATNADIIRIRDQVKEARTVKPGTDDYDEAQAFIRAAEKKYGKAVQ